ncbi:hypothetical protein L7F22_040906 [Adiantum nelumboides]|nr:hypothetical protein [Adiantum nelumboides]
MPPHSLLEPSLLDLLPSPSPPYKPRTFSVPEIRSHNSRDSCWLVIRNSVYDVTSWIPYHPGGPLIYVNAGRDCTQLFDAYHPLCVRVMLARFYIGELEKSAGTEFKDFTLLEYESPGKEDFYLTLKTRVENYFHKLQINPRMHPHMLIKSFLIIFCFILSYYMTFFGSQKFGPSVFFAIVAGLMAAEIGMSIQHDANHGSYTKWRRLGYLMSITIDLVGVSSFMWRQQHVVGHHSFTNVNGYDPDIRVLKPNVWRLTREQPRRTHHNFQHIYLPLLYGILALKSVLYDDFVSYFMGSIGFVKIPKMTTLELSIFWGTKVAYAVYMFLLPGLFSHYSTRDIICLYVVMQLVFGWVLAFLFQVAHVVEEAAFPVVDSSNGHPMLPRGWAASQVSSTANFSPASTFWMHVTGGLNHQIEHHLFPGICHIYYPEIHPIVKMTCKEFNVPYHCFPTLWAALAAHLRYLKKAGAKSFDFRLNG